MDFNQDVALEEEKSPKKKTAKKAAPPEVRVDMTINNSRFGWQKTLDGPVTGEKVHLFARLGESHGVDKDGISKPGVNSEDADAIEQIEVKFWCPRTEEYCWAKPFQIVI